VARIQPGERSPRLSLKNALGHLGRKLRLIFCYELRSFRAAITASGIATVLLYVVPVNN
jgi:hypothetical protein